MKIDPKWRILLINFSIINLNNSTKEFVKSELTSKYTFPSKEDELHDIVNAIFRLEDTYKIEPIAMANGNASEIYLSPKLDGID